MNRVERIKKKYGIGCFSKWGRAGGSPIIRDFKAGRLVRRSDIKHK